MFTLRARLRPPAPGATSHAVLDKFAAIQMLDAHFPITDGRPLICYTQPEDEQKLVLQKLNLLRPRSLRLVSQPPIKWWDPRPDYGEDLLIVALVLSSFPG